MTVRELHKNFILVIVAVAQFMVVLDTSIMNVALPSIFRALHFTSEANLQWVVTAYTLAFGGFLLLGGRAADLYGRKRIFMISVSAFALLSLVTGLSQSSTMIEITRAIQGLTAAFMSPAALSIVLTTFREGKERAKALSVWGAVAAGGAAAGVLLGGVLTQYLNWRWNFFVNVPVGILITILASRYVPESKADLEHTKLDLPGAVLGTAGLMLLVFSLSKAPSYGWGSTKTLVLLGLSVVILVAFVFNEARSRHALMPLSIFRVGNVAAANLTVLPIVASMFSMFFFVTLYMQLILHFTPLKTGLSFLPIPFVIGGISVMMQHVVTRIGYKLPLVVSPLFMAGGIYWLSKIPVFGSYWRDVFPGLLIIGVGLGISFISMTIAATNGVPPRESGLASGLLNTAQQIGGSLGLAILSGVATSVTASYLQRHVYTATQPLTQATAQVTGFRHALVVGASFGVLASVVALVGIRRKPGEQINADVTTEPQLEETTQGISVAGQR